MPFIRLGTRKPNKVRQEKGRASTLGEREMPITLKNSAQAASEMITTEEAAALLAVSRRYLDKDRHEARHNGTPPKVPYTHLGHRTVRYRRADVAAYIDANRVE